MGSVADNKIYYEDYDWSSGGVEWSAPWGGTRSMWLASIFPRVGPYLPARRVIEIGCGHGRVSRILHAFTTDRLMLFDIIDNCVAVCVKALEGSSKATCSRTDGLSLPGVEDRSVDLAFSFYSLVGANAETISSYLHELDRVLDRDGVAFLHHSNARAFFHPDTSDPRMSLLAAYRDVSVDATRMREMAARNGLMCVRQECINWDLDNVLTDCFSTVVRPDSKWAREPELIQNPGFHRERELARMRARRASRMPGQARRIS